MMNPNQLINQILGNNQVMKNPIVKNAYDLMQKNDINGLREVATNLCNQKGIPLNEMEKQIKNRFGL